jgi:hypothetical protein
MRQVLVVCGMAVVMAACDDGSDGTAGTPIGSDPMQPAPGTTVTPTVIPGGTRCNDLDLAQASYINDVRGNGVPAMSGGAIADGTYVVTKYEWHNPINGLHMRRTVMTIAGDRVQWAQHRDREKELRATATFTASGDRISFQMICGDEPLPWDRYSASGGALLLHDEQDVKTATFAPR